MGHMIFKTIRSGGIPFSVQVKPHAVLKPIFDTTKFVLVAEGLPTAPTVPSMPRVPTMPGVPTVPTAPSMPAMPGVGFLSLGYDGVIRPNWHDGVIIPNQIYPNLA